MSLLKNLSVASGVFMAVFILNIVSAQNELEYSSQNNLESTDEIQDLLRKVQVLYERQMRNELKQDDQEEEQSEEENIKCKCANLACSCCAFIRIPKFKIAENCCLSLSYFPRSYAIRVTLKIGSHTIFAKTVSARNPPPVCIGVPFIVPGASVCIEFNNLDVGRRYFAGCSKLAAYLFRFPLVKVNLGCFRMKFLNAEQQVVLVEQQFIEEPRFPEENKEPVSMEKIQPSVNDKK